MEVKPTVFLKENSMGFCLNCKKYLSVGPLKTFTGKPVCGRCREAEAVPADFYDKLAQHMYFPCINDRYGCTALLAWGSVLAHEENCEFSPAIFPAINCYEKLQKDKILVHFESNHKNLILSSDNDFRFPYNYQCPINMIIVWEEHIFVLKIISSSSSHFLGIFSWESLDTKERRYSIFFEDIIQKKPVGGESIVEYEEEINDKSTMIAVDMKYMKQNFNVDTVFCSVSICSESSEGDYSNERLLAVLECPICEEYIKPPIWMCSLGHSICSACKPKVRLCPTCQNALTDKQNITLEEVIEHIDFPCKFKDLGCCFKGTSTGGSLHQRTCSYRGKREIKCYIEDCSWYECQSKMFSHLLEEHRNHCCLDNSTCLDLDQLKSYSLFMESTNQIFKIDLKHETKVIKFCVKLVETHEMKYSKYKFFVDFKDLNENDRFLKLNGECVISQYNDVEFRNSISIPHNLIKHLVKDRKIQLVLYVVEC